MQDNQAKHKKLIEQLESSLALANELSQPLLAYLIERAIEEAKTAAWPHSLAGGP